LNYIGTPGPPPSATGQDNYRPSAAAVKKKLLRIGAIDREFFDD